MSKCVLSVAALLLLIATPLRAQQPGPGIGGGGSGVGSAAGADRRQMEEDIEIMRRLLSRALAGARADGSMNFLSSAAKALHSVAASPQVGRIHTWDSDGSITARLLGGQFATIHGVNLEGVYLKGYGVVYTVTLPPEVLRTKTGAAPPTAKRLSDWERVRKEIRGDKTEATHSVLPAPPSLTETILHVLARNGRHFTQLGANEKLTVVVTFREPQQGTGSGGAGPGGMGGMSMGGGMMGAGARPRSGKYSPGAGMPGAPMMQPSSSVRDYELAGDLHLKQNHIGEALTAYKNALDILAKVSGPASDAQRRTIYSKLARAYLGMIDHLDQKKQEQIVNRAIEFLRNAQHPKGGEQPMASTHLPARLIISAPKSLLDQVGSGKMTFEDFRRAASVESVPATTVSQTPASKPR